MSTCVMEIIGNRVVLKTLDLELPKFRVGEEHTIGFDTLLHMVDIQRPIFIQLLVTPRRNPL